MTNRYLIIILGLAAVASIAALYFSGVLSFGEGGYPAVQPLQANAESSDRSSAAPGTSSGGGLIALGGQALAAEDGEASPDEDGESAGADEGDEEQESSEETPEPGNDEEASDEDAEADGEDAEAGGEDAEADGDDAEADDDEEAVSEEEEELADDPLAKFSAMDPRDLIIQKYDDLKEKQTEPWNPDSEDFVPETGRVDPLTLVDKAIPDELKPPRSGETDENEIQNYLNTQFATRRAKLVLNEIECHNVIQIGLVKFATFGIPGSLQTIQEGGSSLPFFVEVVDGVGFFATFSVPSISTNEVVVRVTISGLGTSTNVSREGIFIPRTWGSS